MIPTIAEHHIEDGHCMAMSLLVVKIGGGAGLNLDHCLEDIARLSQERPVIVVHGVSEMMNHLCEQRGIEVQMLTSPSGHSSRYTNAEARAVYVDACNIVNDTIVSRLRDMGVPAQGFTDADVLISGTRKSAIRAMVNGRRRVVRDDYSGAIDSTDVYPLMPLLAEGGMAVLPPLAFSADGLLNVDGDRAAAAVAGAIHADDFVILSNVRGLYRNFPDENSFVNEVRNMEDAMQWAQGRMKRKVLGAQEALNGGVQRVIIADGRDYNPLSGALSGNGTTFVGRRESGVYADHAASDF